MLTDDGKKLLSSFVTSNEEESPFEKQGKDVYVKFDGLKIVNADEDNKVDVIFNWRGKAICQIRIEGTQIRIGTELNITGLEGRSLLSID